MTAARVEKVYPDTLRAREFLDQAEMHLQDASRGELHAPSTVILLHSATVAACDAILQAVGLRVTPGDRAHVLRIETALDQLGGDTEDLLEQLDASREPRNEASYAVSFVAQASVADAREATAELLALVRSFLG